MAFFENLSKKEQHYECYSGRSVMIDTVMMGLSRDQTKQLSKVSVTVILQLELEITIILRQLVKNMMGNFLLSRERK